MLSPAFLFINESRTVTLLPRDHFNIFILVFMCETRPNKQTSEVFQTSLFLSCELRLHLLEHLISANISASYFFKEDLRR